MAYYNNFDNRNGGYNNRGYNNNRNFNNRGYNNQGYAPQQPQHEFQFGIGEVVTHRTTGVEMTVISYGREQVECRLPDLSAKYFYEHELMPVAPKNG